MSFLIADNFELLSKHPLDERQQFKTIEEMRDFKEYDLAEGLIAFNIYDSKTYQFKSTNTFDPTYGKWREFGANTEDLEILSFAMMPEFGEKDVATNVIIEWEYSKDIKSQVVTNNNTGAIALDDNTGLIRMLAVTLTKDTSFTIVGTDINGSTATATIEYKAVNPCYIGVIANEVDIATLTESDIITNLTKIINKDNHLIWEDLICEYSTLIIALPSILGELTSVIDQHGLEYIRSFIKHDMTINTENYYVYVFNSPITLTHKHTFTIE